MADIQAQFNKFHNETVKLIDENKILRERRDKLKEDLEAGLKEDDPKVLEYINQGSYAIYTGVKPKDGDYDIDVGVVMDCSKDDYKPVKLKEIVKNALENNFRKPDIRRPCVTTQYTKNGNKDYHVDMPVYVKDGDDYCIAMGKLNSCDENKYWDNSDPKYLVDWINEISDDSSVRDQFRRIVKYLKYWKSHKLCDGTPPPSIGFTIFSRNHFNAVIDQYSDTANDLKALRNLVQTMIDHFSFIGLDEDLHSIYRLKVKLPCTPYKDTFEKVTDKKMTTFKEKLEKFRDDLNEAISEERADVACRAVRRQLKDFPEAEKKTTAKKLGASMTNVGSSS